MVRNEIAGRAMMSPQDKGFGVAGAPGRKGETWECRCTLVNGVKDTRCIACGTPKARQAQLGTGRASPAQSGAANGSIPSGNAVPKESRCTGTNSVVNVNAITTVGASEEPKKRGRPSLSQTEKTSGHNKRSKVSPGRKSGSLAGAGSEKSPGSQSGVASLAVAVARLATACGGGGKRSGSGSSSSSSSTARKGSKVSATSEAAIAAGLTPQPPPSITKETILKQVQEQQELHLLQRRSVGAALARSAFSKVRGLKWQDVNVDWCPEESLQEAEATICSKLGIETLATGSGGTGGSSAWGSRGCVRGGGGGSGRGNGVAAGAKAASVGGEEGGEEELRMSLLFPLPPPKPLRFVKRGVYALDSTATVDATTSLEQTPPPTVQPGEGRILESEVVMPQPRRGVAAGAAGFQRSTSSGSDGSGTTTTTTCAVPPFGSNGGGCSGDGSRMGVVKGTDAAGSDGKKSREATSSRGSTSSEATAGGEAAIGKGDIDSDPADGTDDSASATGGVADSLQWSMTAAERSKAYNAIFKNGGQPKKRPRSPVVNTPLRLPFPTAPRGVSLAAKDLDDRPPCGEADDVQTEIGSEWAWGLLGEDEMMGEEGSVAGSAQGEGVGARYRDFRLPYEILYDERHAEFLSEVGKLGMRSARDALTEFQTVTANVYLSKKPPSKDDGESHTCNCRPPPSGQPGCMEACSNHSTREECTKRTCGVEGKALCGNRKIQRYKHSNLVKKVGVKDMGAKGVGLVAKVPIPAGSLIGEYVGEVMSEEDWQQRQALLGDSQKHKYVMDLGEGEVIDASRKGSILRFVNHSCGPNAETQKWTVQGRRRIGLFAKDDITKGEEVTFNYCYVRYDEEARECLCGHSNCVQTLGTRRGECDEVGGRAFGSGGVGGDGGGGGGGQGEGGGVGRGQGGKASPKWQDPETGERVRPWLHPEDAENIEKFTIRNINNEGRLSARDHSVVSKKLLFLPRNIPRACRRLVVEQATIANTAGGGVNRATGSKAVVDSVGMGLEKKPSEGETRADKLQARITAQEEKCAAFAQGGVPTANPDDGGGDDAEGNDRNTSGGDAQPWPPSVQGVRLYVLKMQADVLREGRKEAARETLRLHTTTAAARAASAAADGVGMWNAASSTATSHPTSAAATSDVAGGVVRRGRGRPKGSGKRAKAVAKAAERPVRASRGIAQNDVAVTLLTTNAAGANGKVKLAAEEEAAVAAVGSIAESKKLPVETKPTVVGKKKPLTGGAITEDPNKETGKMASPKKMTIQKENQQEQQDRSLSATRDRKKSEKGHGVDDQGSRKPKTERHLPDSSPALASDGGANGSRKLVASPAGKNTKDRSASTTAGRDARRGRDNRDSRSRDRRIRRSRSPASSARSSWERGRSEFDRRTVERRQNNDNDSLGRDKDRGSNSCAPPSSSRRRRSRSRSRSRSPSFFSRSGSVRSWSNVRDNASRSPRSPRRQDSHRRDRNRPAEGERSRTDSKDGDRGRRSSVRGTSIRRSAGSLSRDSHDRSHSLSGKDSSLQPPASTERPRRAAGKDERDRGGISLDHTPRRLSRERRDDSRADSRDRRRPIAEGNSVESGRDRGRERDDSPRRRDASRGGDSSSRRGGHSPPCKERDSRDRLRKRDDSRHRVSASRFAEEDVNNNRERGEKHRAPTRKEESFDEYDDERKRDDARDRDSGRDVLRFPSPQNGVRDNSEPAASASKAAKGSARCSPCKQSYTNSSPAKEPKSGSIDGVASDKDNEEEEESPPSSRPLAAAVAAVSAAATAPGGNGGAREYDSESSMTDTDVTALRSMVAQHGMDWREKIGFEAHEALAEEKETIKVRKKQALGELPPDEDPKLKARQIMSVMIRTASLKLPHEVHRKILDIFQVMILEPYYYPPIDEINGSPPAYVIGPIAHVRQACNALEAFHSRSAKNRLEATVKNVMDVAMDRVLDIRRANHAADSLKRAQKFDVTPEAAESLLDRRRLAWVGSECCRLTGSTSVSASRERVSRQNGATMCKVTIVGTPRQRAEAWEILQAVLVRYPLVEAFMKTHPRPLRSARTVVGTGSTNAIAGPPVTPPSSTTPSTGKPRLGFGQGLLSRSAVAAASASAVEDHAEGKIPARISQQTPSVQPAGGGNGDKPVTATPAATSSSHAGIGASETPATAVPPPRKSLQFGQGFKSGFKMMTPLPEEKADKQPAVEEWKDDGWGLPPDDDDTDADIASLLGVGGATIGRVNDGSVVGRDSAGVVDPPRREGGKRHVGGKSRDSKRSARKGGTAIPGSRSSSKSKALHAERKRKLTREKTAGDFEPKLANGISSAKDARSGVKGRRGRDPEHRAVSVSAGNDRPRKERRSALLAGRDIKAARRSDDPRLKPKPSVVVKKTLELSETGDTGRDGSDAKKEPPVSHKDPTTTFFPSGQVSAPSEIPSPLISTPSKSPKLSARGSTAAATRQEKPSPQSAQAPTHGKGVNSPSHTITPQQRDEKKILTKHEKKSTLSENVRSGKTKRKGSVAAEGEKTPRKKPKATSSIVAGVRSTPGFVDGASDGKSGATALNLGKVTTAAEAAVTARVAVGVVELKGLESSMGRNYGRDDGDRGRETPDDTTSERNISLNTEPRRDGDGAGGDARDGGGSGGGSGGDNRDSRHHGSSRDGRVGRGPTTPGKDRSRQDRRDHTASPDRPRDRGHRRKHDERGGRGRRAGDAGGSAESGRKRPRDRSKIQATGRTDSLVRGSRSRDRARSGERDVRQRRDRGSSRESGSAERAVVVTAERGERGGDGRRDNSRERSASRGTVRASRAARSPADKVRSPDKRDSKNMRGRERSPDRRRRSRTRSRERDHSSYSRSRSRSPEDRRFRQERSRSRDRTERA